MKTVPRWRSRCLWLHRLTQPWMPTHLALAKALHHRHHPPFEGGSARFVAARGVTGFVVVLFRYYAKYPLGGSMVDPSADKDVQGAVWGWVKIEADGILLACHFHLVILNSRTNS